MPSVKKNGPFFLYLRAAVHAPLYALDRDIAAFGSLAGYDREKQAPFLWKPEDANARKDGQMYAGMMCTPTHPENKEGQDRGMETSRGRRQPWSGPHAGIEVSFA